MSEFYRVRSEAYFRLSEIFVNRRDYGREKVRILLIGETLAGEGIQNSNQGTVEKLRMRVDIVAVTAFHYLGYLPSLSFST